MSYNSTHVRLDKAGPVGSDNNHDETQIACVNFTLRPLSSMQNTHFVLLAFAGTLPNRFTLRAIAPNGLYRGTSVIIFFVVAAY